VVEHLPNLSDLAPAAFFLFPRIMRELAGLTVTRNTFKMNRRGLCGPPRHAADFAETFQR
jgi:hypothetical protein